MNDKEIRSVLKEVNKLLKRLEKKGQQPSKQELSLLEDITEQIELKRGKIKEERDQSLVDKLESLVKLSLENKDVSVETTKSIVDAIEKIKLVVPSPTVTVEPPKVEVNVPEVKVPAVKVPDVVVNMPEEIKVSKPSWINGLVNLLPITVLLQGIRDAIPAIVWPSGAREPISVRLSDGEKFYRALGGTSGAASIPTYKNSAGEAKQGLLDDNGYQYAIIAETTPTDISKTNPSETITETLNGSVLTTVVQKVISGTTYTKTIVENYTTGVTTETTWS